MITAVPGTDVKKFAKRLLKNPRQTGDARDAHHAWCCTLALQSDNIDARLFNFFKDAYMDVNDKEEDDDEASALEDLRPLLRILFKERDTL